MGEISKHLFESKCKDLECSVFLHPWNRSCAKAFPYTLFRSLKGSAKFYGTIYFIQALLQNKKLLKKRELIKFGEYYLRSTLMGSLIATTGDHFSCIIRWLSGDKMYYYNYLLIPNMISGLFIFMEPPGRRGLVVNLFVNLVIEYFIRLGQRKGHVNFSTPKQTLVFMAGSALLFYLMRLEGEKKKRTPLFWLFTPEKVRKPTDSSKVVCPHDGSCRKHIFKTVAIYFGLGLSLGLSRVVVPNLLTPWGVLAMLRRQHFNMAWFFGTYVGLYKAIICYLCRKHGVDSESYALPAGFIAGLSFMFSPNIGISIASATSAAKLFTTILYEKNLLPNTVPLPELTFCVCQGILFHAQLSHPDDCPKYIMKLMLGCSDNLIGEVFENVRRVIHQ